MANKNWIAAATQAVAKRTISITGALATAMGVWLILIAAATKGPEFLNSKKTIYAVQLMAIGGVAQHTKQLRK